MRRRDRARAGELERALTMFDRTKVSLPGIDDWNERSSFVEQLLESIRRVKYVKVIRKRDISPLRADPNSVLFDPLRASILHEEAGDLDEASWLVFLFVHFGKHAKAGWRYLRDVYGSLGVDGNWTWARTSADPAKFRAWLNLNLAEIKARGWTSRIWQPSEIPKLGRILKFWHGLGRGNVRKLG